MISPNYAVFYFNIHSPQQQNQQSVMQDYLMLPTSQWSNFKGTLLPPCYHSSGASFDVTPVDQMTIYQTANWIKTLGGYYGWTQAEAYAEKFINNSITGVLLQELTPEMLETSIGMRNQRHQRELFSAIKYLWSNIRPKNEAEFLENISGIQMLESSYSNESNGGRCLSETECESTNSYLISSHSKNTAESVQMEYSDMSESGYSQRSSGVSSIDSDHPYVRSDEYSIHKSSSFCTSNDKLDVAMDDREALEHMKGVVPFKVRRPLRCRKLKLHLREDQIDEDSCPLLLIRSRFQELNIKVDIEPTENKSNTYTLVFPNYQRAEEIRLRADEIGYKLTKNYPPRPNPRSPRKYKSMAELTIRTGKALNKEIVGTLKKGEIVTVNQIKGRRARLIKEKENGDFESIGWVSLHAQDGVNLLKQMGDF